jgi:hypothetical protein
MFDEFSSVFYRSTFLLSSSSDILSIHISPRLAIQAGNRLMVRLVTLLPSLRELFLTKRYQTWKKKQLLHGNDRKMR